MLPADSPLRPGLLLDRDGVVNHDAGYVYRIADFEWLPGIRELAAQAVAQGAAVAVITNQSGIARGYYSHHDLAVLHAHMAEGFAQAGAPLAGVFYCPHLPEISNCLCRKPKSLLLRRAMALLRLDPRRTVMLGDAERDLLPARALGLKTAWVRHPAATPPQRVLPDYALSHGPDMLRVLGALK